MQKTRQFYLLIGALVILVMIFFFFPKQHDPASPCTKKGVTEKIQILHNTFTPQQLIVKKCDTVVIENVDTKQSYRPDFGKYPKHMAYAGFTEKTLLYKQKNSFVAGMLGVFSLSDFQKGQAFATLVVLDQSKPFR